MSKYNISDLLYLIRLALRSLGLQVQDFDDAFTRIDVMTPSNSFLKTELFKYPGHSRERNIGVRIPAKYLIEQLCSAHHAEPILSHSTGGDVHEPLEAAYWVSRRSSSYSSLRRVSSLI
jgi:hypothetical protein